MKTVLFMAGGGMSGVFGAGVVKHLQDNNFYSHLDTVYGASAGGFNAAYFLTKEVDLGASIYFEEARQYFLEPAKLWRGAWQRYLKGPIYTAHPDHYINAMHLDYIGQVIAKQKPLNLKRLVEQPIPFFLKVFDQHLHQIRYLSIKYDDPLKLLLASASLPPYTFEFELIHHHRMVDSCVAEVIGLNYLLHKHPHQKIVIILNRRPKQSFTNRLICTMESIIGSRMYGHSYRDLPYARESNFRAEVALAQLQPNVLLVMPPPRSQTGPGTTNLKKLKQTYQLGQQAGRRVIEFSQS